VRGAASGQVRPGRRWDPAGHRRFVAYVHQL